LWLDTLVDKRVTARFFITLLCSAVTGLLRTAELLATGFFFKGEAVCPKAAVMIIDNAAMPLRIRRMSS
jgi:hypothetical protein